MSRGKYTHIKVMEEEILELKAAGKTKREIAEHLGLKQEQIKGFLKRHRRNERKIEAGIFPKVKGRPRKDAPAKDILTEQAYEIERLKRENRLLRDFLQSVGRR